MARRRFFVEKLDAGRAVVRGEHAHHLYHVLRVKPGQSFEISDTQRLYLGRVVAARASAVEFAIEQELPPVAPVPQVTLLAAIFRFDRMEWMVEKVTELGAAKMVPVVAARTEKRLAQAAPKRVERWRRIAFEAAQQSHRIAPLEISEITLLDRVLDDAREGRRFMLDESPQAPRGKALMEPASGSNTVLLVGPEGGWTEMERQQAQAHGFIPVGLGPQILRAETAAVAALAVLLYANSDQTDLQ